MTSSKWLQDNLLKLFDLNIHERGTLIAIIVDTLKRSPLKENEELERLLGGCNQLKNNTIKDDKGITVKK